MKVIVLHAFGGALKSGFIQVQEWSPDYRVPYRLEKDKIGCYAKPVDLSKIDSPIMKIARFVRTDRFVDLENKNVAMIYELESM
jgi:hypothetical protein